MAFFPKPQETSKFLIIQPGKKPVQEHLTVVRGKSTPQGTEERLATAEKPRLFGGVVTSKPLTGS